MPWRPLPQIAFGIAKRPFQPAEGTDLPLELGDELYIIEEGGKHWEWYRGYLVAPPSLLAGLTSVKGQALEARVFSGIFPRNCVEIKEYLGREESSEAREHGRSRAASGSRQSLSEKRQDVLQNGVGPEDKAGLPAKHERKASQKFAGPPQSPTSPTFVPPALGPDGQRIRPPAPVPMLKIGDESPTSASEPLVDEIASCLREWHSTNLHELLLSRQYVCLDQLSGLVNQLDVARRQLMHGVLTEQELETLREKTVWDLVKGNTMLQNDIVVRDPKLKGRLLLESDDPIEISKLQSTMSLLDQPPKPAPESFNLHHLLVETREVANDRADSPKLVLYLASRKGDGPLMQLSESFMLEVPAREHLQRSVSAGRLRTIFTNLLGTDIGSVSGSDAKLFLVVKVQVNYVPPPRPPESQRATLQKEAHRNGVVSAPPAPVGGKSGRRSILFGSKTATQRHKSVKMDDISESADEGSNADITEKRPTTLGIAEGAQYVKRFIGAGILPLEEIIKTPGESDSVISVWAPGDQSESGSNAIGYNRLLEQVLASTDHRWSRLKGLSQIQFHFHSFASPDVETLIRQTPTLLHNIMQTPKVGFSGAPTKPRSDIYITIVEPNIPPAASFLHPEKGAVEIPNAANMYNLQLTLEVRKSDGERITRCIFPSSESSGQTAWRSTAIRRGEKWNQTFRLEIPPEDVPSAHIIMSIAEFSEFPFALAWIPLWTNGAFVQDGEHFPNLHMYDQTTSHTESGRGAYLDLPWNSKTGDKSKLSSLAGPVATLKLESYLCSTFFSQDQVLLRILKWKEETDDQLLVLLRQLSFVPEIEIVKLVNEVLDALFGILVDRAGNEEFEDLAFAAIVTVLGIVHDRRFRLDPVVNEYAEHRFDFPAAVSCLIQSYLRLITAPSDYQNSRQLRATFKVGKQIMQFIIMARRQQIKNETYVGITNSQTTFNIDLKSIFLGFEQQMREESAAHVGSKTLIVQHMHTWLPELAPCFTQDQILKATASFLESCDNVHGKLVLHKLVLIWNVLKSALESPCEYLPMFKERVVAWIHEYWGETDEVTEQYRDQVRLCCSIVALMREQYGPLVLPLLVDITTTYRCIAKAERPTGQHLSLLFPSTYPFPTRPFLRPRDFDENLIELSAVMATLPAGEMSQYADFSAPNPWQSTEVALDISASLLAGEAYPASWLTLHSFHHRTVFDHIEDLLQSLKNSALPSPDDADQFNIELWRKYIMGILTLVRSPALSLETFPEQKRRAVWKICGDIRERGAALLLEVWNDLGWETDADEKRRFGLERLGGYQVQYVPSLVAPVMELCLSVHEGLRRAAVEVLHSMIVGEWSLNEDLAVVQAEIIDCLDNLFKAEALGDGTHQRMFINELSGMFEPLSDTPDKGLWQAIQDLLATVDHLLDLLFAVHAPEQNELTRIMHTLRLMEFLKGIKKQDIFISYIHKLSAAEAEADNFKEAGLALRLHADIYSWDTTDVLDALPEPKFPKQTAFERRERIFFEMIQFFEEGQAWEPALACYKELAEQYETNVYDFSKLARTQRAMAKIYEQIARGHIDAPRYFRVVYRGHGFSTALRDKTFIFESANTERLAGFIDRLQQQYPSAHVSSREETENIEGQYIQVTSVTPHRNLDHPIWQRTKVPHATKEFLAGTQTSKFAVTTRRHSDKSLYKDQSVEKTVYTTLNTFPAILQRSEVHAEEVTTLDALDTALDRTLRKIAELAILNHRAEHGDQASMQGLLEAIRSSVDPASTSSVAQYRKMLPDKLPSSAGDDDDDDAAPHFTPHQQALHVALVDFASCIRQSLSKLAGPTHHQEQIILSRHFHAAFAPELAIIAPVPTALPATQWATVTSLSDSLASSAPRSAPPIPSSAGETTTTITAAKRQSRLGGMFKRSTVAIPSDHSLLEGINGSLVAGTHRPTGILSPTDDSRSLPSSRNSVAEKRSSQISIVSEDVEDTSDVPTPRKSEFPRDRTDSLRDRTNSLRDRTDGLPARSDSLRYRTDSTQDRPHTAREQRSRSDMSRGQRSRSNASREKIPVETERGAKHPQVAALQRSGGKKPGSLRRRLSTLGLVKKSSRGAILSEVSQTSLAEE